MANKHSEHFCPRGSAETENAPGQGGAQMKIDTLERRILLSVTWVDTDANEEIDEAGPGDEVNPDDAAHEYLNGLEEADLLFAEPNDAPSAVDAKTDLDVAEGTVAQLPDVGADLEERLGISHSVKETFDDDDSLEDWYSTRGEWEVVGGELHDSGDGEHRIWLDETLEEDMDVHLGARLEDGSGFGVWLAESTDPVTGYSVQYDPLYGGILLRQWDHGHEHAGVQLPRAGVFCLYGVGWPGRH